MTRKKKANIPTPEEFRDLIIKIKDEYRGGDFVALKIKILDAILELLEKLGYEEAINEFEDDDFYVEYN